MIAYVFFLEIALKVEIISLFNVVTRRIWDDMMKLCLVSNVVCVGELDCLGARELKGKGLRVIVCKLAW